MAANRNEAIVTPARDYPALVARIFMVRASYHDPNAEAPDDGLAPPPAFQLKLSMTRLAWNRMVVCLGAEGMPGGAFEISAEYGVELELPEDMPRDLVGLEFHHLATMSAPSLLFPYLRETVGNLTSRGAPYSLALPLLGLPLDLAIEDFALPEAPGDKAEIDLFESFELQQ